MDALVPHEKPDFVISVPRGWKEGRPDRRNNAYQWRSPDRTEQLVVGSFAIQARAPAGYADKLLDQLAEAETQTLLALSGGRGKLQRKRREVDGRTWMVTSGLDPANGIRFTFVYVAAPRQVVRIRYQHYGMDAHQNDVEQKALAFAQTLELPKAK